MRLGWEGGGRKVGMVEGIVGAEAGLGGEGDRGEGKWASTI